MFNTTHKRRFTHSTEEAIQHKKVNALTTRSLFTPEKKYALALNLKGQANAAYKKAEQLANTKIDNPRFLNGPFFNRIRTGIITNLVEAQQKYRESYDLMNDPEVAIKTLYTLYLLENEFACFTYHHTRQLFFEQKVNQLAAINISEYPIACYFILRDLHNKYFDAQKNADSDTMATIREQTNIFIVKRVMPALANSIEEEKVSWYNFSLLTAQEKFDINVSLYNLPGLDLPLEILTNANPKIESRLELSLPFPLREESPLVEIPAELRAIFEL
jgi:hypothetical protein